MNWLEKVGRWLKAAARVIAWVAGIALAVLLAVIGIQLYKKAIRGKVQSPQPFSPVVGRTDCIDVTAPWGVERVQLPAGMTSDKVTAAEVVKGGPVKVEAVHETIDRRSLLGSGSSGGSG